jgi:hypothetical protein
MKTNKELLTGNVYAGAQPDPIKHQIISFLKSGVRITGYTALLYSLSLGIFILIISEAIGIIEELV